jgi:hypothetical protein
MINAKPNNPMTHDPRRTERKADYQPGYSGVLLRDDLKQQLRDFRSSRGLRDSHYERCLVSASLELALKPEHETALMGLLAGAIAADFQIGTSNSSQAHELRNSAQSPRSI